MARRSTAPIPRATRTKSIRTRACKDTCKARRPFPWRLPPRGPTPNPGRTSKPTDPSDTFGRTRSDPLAGTASPAALRRAAAESTVAEAQLALDQGRPLGRAAPGGERAPRWEPEAAVEAADTARGPQRPKLPRSSRACMRGRRRSDADIGSWPFQTIIRLWSGRESLSFCRRHRHGTTIVIGTRRRVLNTQPLFPSLLTRQAAARARSYVPTWPAERTRYSATIVSWLTAEPS